jgi:hypothetical protein
MRNDVFILMMLFPAMMYCQYNIAQNDSINKVKYDMSYNFKDGIYLNFLQFRNNMPVSFSSTNLPDPSQTAPKDALLAKDRISFFDGYGIKQHVLVDSIWGYAYNNKIHINWSGNFHLVPYIGKISHFVAKVQVRNDNRANPFYDPYYVYTGPSSYVTSQTMQMLLDAESGGVYKFEPENVLKMIRDAPDLYNEFSDMRKRQQRKKMFYYVRQYNEKKALYFPDN